ncbi:MAG: hypothetical protein GWM98_02160, partial [Nitrospinaceae bacterium]|nr:hypothetical protein [Nitrospinaceae bacterium]NIR53522.1 hypothetical protein [Nitrospinaceae bacterium]NIS83921.1 hypothetical protein [Nitrospinaceae bacterium]NIT80729.1 hypothetical protein [Nitrospinaceae bacterium]NIU43038.1 hypothetical protein [Nitrospinaceae bacterium]
PVEEIRKAAQEGEHEFVVVSLKVQKPLKGDPGASVLDFRYYTDTERYGGVTRRQILAFDGRPVIVFLQRVRGKYYLAVYSPDAMQKA